MARLAPVLVAALVVPLAALPLRMRCGRRSGAPWLPWTATSLAGGSGAAWMRACLATIQLLLLLEAPQQSVEAEQEGLTAATTRMLALQALLAWEGMQA